MKTVTIFNVTNANTLINKVIGLLNSSHPKPLYFQTRWGIHTFGMQYPIDVVVLDNNFIVKKLKKNMVPNRLFFWPPRFKNILELPPTFIKKRNIKLGDKLTLNP